MFCSKKKKAVSVGDVAPDFELPDQSGAAVRLNSFRGKTVVLYFYPKDDTYGCIAESSDFRDYYPRFQAANAEVIGISSDSTESHLRFTQKYGLPFRLLSDTGGRIRSLFGVPAAVLGMVPGRVTYVIDPSGVVSDIFNSQFNPKSHVAESLRALNIDVAEKD